jgi:hypothetical protein
MDESQQPHSAQTNQETLLYFWALGDMHYYSHAAWQALHTPRMNQMFQDLRHLWEREEAPTFCVSPGDIVEKGEPEHHQLARQELTRYLNNIPFYPGIGNHELLSSRNQDSQEDLMEIFTTFWEKPPRYYWIEGRVLCIMLDVVGYGEPVISSESLHFLETALAKYPNHLAVIFAHCPLAETVLDRDPALDRDYDTLEPFFSLKNSAEVRQALARHQNACLYITGHTHSGWQAPNLVATENLGGHPVTSVNLSSPWYTGRSHGPIWLDEGTKCMYRPDDPDCICSFAVRIFRDQIQLRLRDHRAGDWLAEWHVPTR